MMSDLIDTISTTVFELSKCQRAFNDISDKYEKTVFLLKQIKSSGDPLLDWRVSESIKILDEIGE